MILSINCTTANGIPRNVDLVPPSPRVSFTTKTNEVIEAYLGNSGITEQLPNGFAVNQSALPKEPWCFSKMLYLKAHSFMAESLDGKQYNHMVDIDQEFLIKGLLFEEDYYGFIVVGPSTDPRYRWWPVMVAI